MSQPAKIYWTERDLGKIQRANLDGSDIEDVLTSGVHGPYEIALDVEAGMMYWTDIYTGIQRASLDGTGLEHLVGMGLADPRGIALDVAGGRIYAIDHYPTGAGANEIRRFDLDGTRGEVLRVRGMSGAYDIALDVPGGKMYWTESATTSSADSIQRADLDGSNVETLVTDLGYPRGIALDLSAGKMYWTDPGTGKIQRANLDGSGVEDLVTDGLSDPQGIAVDPAGGKMYWTDRRDRPHPARQPRRLRGRGPGHRRVAESTGNRPGRHRPEDVLDGLGHGHDPARQPRRLRRRGRGDRRPRGPLGDRRLPALTAAQPQHAVAAALKLVRNRFDGGFDAFRAHRLDRGLNVRRGRAADLQQREDTYLRGDTQHLAQGVEVKAQVELLAVQEQEVRRQPQVEGAVGKRQLGQRCVDVPPWSVPDG